MKQIKWIMSIFILSLLLLGGEVTVTSAANPERGAPSVAGQPGVGAGGSILPTPTPPLTRRSAPERITVAGNVQAEKIIRQVMPVYPPLARQARIQGTVRFMAIIGGNGNILQVQLISGHPLLVQAATDAVRQWTYSPTLVNGVPVEVITQIDVVFTL